jgi:CHAT domain-containing protein/tetratricopeptide (TPR) repeat protein
MNGRGRWPRFAMGAVLGLVLAGSARDGDSAREGTGAADAPRVQSDRSSAAEAPNQETSIEALRKILLQGRYAEAESAAREQLAAVEKARAADSPQTLEVLNALVESLWRGGKAANPESRQLAERAQAIAEKSYGPDDPRLAVSLENLANILRRNDDVAGAKSRLERAFALREKALGPDHADVAESLDQLGLLLDQSGEYAEARKAQERALAIREKALGPVHPDLASSLNNLAKILEHIGDYEGAKPLYVRALGIREKALGPDHPDVAASLTGLASAQMELGDYASSRTLLERALKISESRLGPRHPLVAGNLNNLGILSVKMGDFAGARPLYERALAIYEETSGKESSRVASTLGNLAGLFWDLGNTDEAIRLSRRALAIREKLLGKENPEVALNLHNLAVVVWKAGDRAEAKLLFERALAAQEKALGSDHPDVALTLNSLALLRAEEGDLPDSRKLHERALAIREKALGPEHPDVAESLVNLAGLLLLSGDIDRARTMCERALAIREKAFGAEHPVVAENLNDLASFLWATGDYTAALQRSLRAQAILRRQFERTARSLSEREALDYERLRISGLDLALSVLVLGPKTGPAAANTEKVWDELIRSRGLVLDEMASRHHAASGDEKPETASLAQALSAARNRLAALVVRGPISEQPEDYGAEIAKAEADKERAERDLAEKSAAFRDRLARSRGGLAEVAAALPPGGALVAYVEYEQPPELLGDRQGSSSRPDPGRAYLALVLTSGSKGPVLFPLGPAARIESLIREWKKNLASEPAGLPLAGGRGEARYREAGGRLRKAVWDPLAASLGGASTVFIVPDGALSLVSLSALPASKAGYLVESGPLVHYLSAERDLVGSVSDRPAKKGMLALGGPDFDALRDEPVLKSGALAASKPVTRAAGAEPAYRSPPTSCDDLQKLRFSPLPGSAEEAAEVYSLWLKAGGGDEDGATATKLIGPDATEASFKRRASGYRVLHLATHGFFMENRCPSVLENARARAGQRFTGSREAPAILGDNPLLLSGLALAGANRRQAAGAEAEDGILTAEEIASLDLSGVEWAVLSACETGLGPVMAGEGVLGLRRAFEVAGVKTLIMSLWKVEDQTSREWMRHLYEGRRRGLGTAEATRHASLETLKDLRSRHKSTHPFFWGAFVAAGDWR